MCSRKQGQALGVLIKKLGNKIRPVGYFLKIVENVAQGWPSCLRAVAATALWVEEALKLTVGHFLTVMTSHQAQSVLETKGHQWITGGQLTKY